VPTARNVEARECVRLAYDHLVVAYHYHPRQVIASAKALLLNVYVVLNDELEADPIVDLKDEEEDELVPF